MSPQGYVNNNLRSQVWPLLVDEKLSSHEYRYDYSIEILKHRYWDQVRKDVPRSMFSYDITASMSEDERNIQREKLQRMMDAVLSKNPELHYVQGYHDICSVFLLVCGERKAFHLMETLSKTKIRDLHRDDHLQVIIAVLDLLVPVLKLADPEVQRRNEECKEGKKKTRK